MKLKTLLKMFAGLWVARFVDRGMRRVENEIDKLPIKDIDIL